MPLSLDRTNYLNIALILLSGIIAYVFPFETFLVSYAVLGPLHYFTEISWLHDRQYFAKGKFDYLILLGIMVAIGVLILLRLSTAELVSLLIFVGLAGAIVLATVKGTPLKVFLLAVVFLLGTQIAQGRGMMVFLILLLPSLVHVFLFTMIFMLFGALKAKSITGYISTAVMAIVGVSMLLLSEPLPGYQISGSVRAAYEGFREVNAWLIKSFHLYGSGTMKIDAFDLSGGAIAAARFIGFAYLYHYLNWFSKTSVIRWHEVPRLRFAIVILLWVASLAIYLVDYTLALNVLYFVSFLHVFLEFPLNVKSFVGVFDEAKQRLIPARPVAQPRRS